MILNAILLTLADIGKSGQHAVAILPKARIASSHGVQLTNPTTGYELWLTGSADYAVLEYELDISNDNRDRLLAPLSPRHDVFRIAKGHFILVEAKHLGLRFTSFVPEAVGQAIALMKESGLSQVRFCLSDGKTWMFFVLAMVDNEITYYESPIRTLDIHQNFTARLRETICLIPECLNPSPAATGLFTLRTEDLEDVTLLYTQLRRLNF